MRVIPVLGFVIGFLAGFGFDLTVELAPVIAAVFAGFLPIGIEELIIEPMREARWRRKATGQAEAERASLDVEAESLFRRENGGPTDWGEVAEMRRGSSFSPNPSANLVGR